MQTTSRRTLLAGAAALPVLTVPAFAAASIKDDPTFAAIDRAWKGNKEFLALAKREDEAEGAGIKLDAAPDDHRTPEMIAAVKEAIAARIALAHTVPTTPAGLIALLAFVREYSIDNGSWGLDLYFDGNDEQYAHAYSVEMAIRGMAGELRNWEGLAVAMPSLAVPAMASMPPADADPIFAAIERQERLWAAWTAEKEPAGVPVGSPEYHAHEARFRALGDTYTRGLEELLKTTPTTPQGAASLIAHCLAEDSGLFGSDGKRSHDRWARALLRTLAAAMPALAVQS